MPDARGDDEEEDRRDGREAPGKGVVARERVGGKFPESGAEGGWNTGSRTPREDWASKVAEARVEEEEDRRVGREAPGIGVQARESKGAILKESDADRGWSPRSGLGSEGPGRLAEARGEEEDRVEERREGAGAVGK